MALGHQHVPSRMELVQSPLQVVDALFAQRVLAQGNDTFPAEWGEKSFFKECLGYEDEERFADIPCLNDLDMIAGIPPHSLVRYRGLVQDVFEPEIYASVLRGRVPHSVQGTQTRFITTKYRECVEPIPGMEFEDMGHMGLGQRGACYCVPLPGESAWSRAAAAAMGRQNLHGAPAATVTAGAQKRGRSEDDDVEMASEQPAKPCRPCTEGTRTVAKTDDNVGVQSAADKAAAFGLNFPLPSEAQHGRGSSTPCIVKLYGSEAESLRLCDTIEIVGVLCMNPELTNFQVSHLDVIGLGSDARQPSSALVPRIHAIHVRQLPFYHPLLPFSSAWLSEARLVAAYQRNLGAPEAVVAARNAAITQLTQHLNGDALAAEYLLLLLVSRSFGCHGHQSLGSWALNVANWPHDVPVARLGDALSELVPRSACLEVSTETLGSQRWRPRKDFEANRLVAAQLQLAPGTLLVLDETRLSEGTISGEAVKALAAIGSLVTEQKLTCDYQSYDVHIPLELSCVLVSKQRSIIKDIEVVLPMSAQSPECTLSQASMVQPSSLDAARLLLGIVTRRPRPLQIPDDAAHLLSADFAAVRQEFQVNSGLCNAWLALARAHCLTFAEEALTPSRWQAVLGCERQRLQRCRDNSIAYS